MTQELSVEEQKDESPWSRWWWSLKERRGDRAALRRCRSPLEVALEPAFHDLLKRLGSRLPEVERDRIAAAAGVLANVDANTPARSLAELMARPRGGKPAVSDLRFRRLLRLETGEELMRELGRVLQLLDGEAPVANLANDVFRWGDSVRKRWALDYYGAAPRS